MTTTTTKRSSDVFNPTTGGTVRWLDGSGMGNAVPAADGTFTVYSCNLVTGGLREDRGIVLGLHVEAA